MIGFETGNGMVRKVLDLKIEGEQVRRIKKLEEIRDAADALFRAFQGNLSHTLERDILFWRLAELKEMERKSHGH